MSPLPRPATYNPQVEPERSWLLSNRLPQRAAAAAASNPQPSNGIPAVQALQQRLLQCAAAAAANDHPAVAAVSSCAAPAP